jgi:hypothetical protein
MWKTFLGGFRRKWYCKGMEEHSKNNGNFPQQADPASEDLPKDSEGVGNGSEEASEIDPQIRNHAERTEDHTITVREAAKIFEEANLPVTERTIINWCNPNKRGIVRLDCYFDEGDGKYFITPQSIEQVIKEESPRAKASQHVQFNFSESKHKISEPSGKASEKARKVSEEVPKYAETDSESFGNGAEKPGDSIGNNNDEIRKLRQQLMDEKILNKGKDFFIEQLQKDRGAFANERQELIQQMVLQGERIGKLETELRQLQAPRQNGEPHGRTTSQDENDQEEGSPKAGGQVNEDERTRREGWQSG